MSAHWRDEKFTKTVVGKHEWRDVVIGGRIILKLIFMDL
jgi:hypothetical protein